MKETTEERHSRLLHEVCDHPNYRDGWRVYYYEHRDTFEGGIPAYPGSAIQKWSSNLMEKWLGENESSFFDDEREAELDIEDDINDDMMADILRNCMMEVR